MGYYNISEEDLKLIDDNLQKISIRLKRHYDTLNEQERVKRYMDIIVDNVEIIMQHHNTLKSDKKKEYKLVTKTRGDIRKLKNFKSLDANINTLKRLNHPVVSNIIRSYELLRDNKSHWIRAYKIKQTIVSLLYETVTLALVASVSQVYAHILNKQESSKNNQFVINMADIKKDINDLPHIAPFDTLEKFVEFSRHGYLGRMFETLYPHLNEQVIASVIIYSILGISGIVLLITILRHMIYFYYYARVSIADYLRFQADLLNSHRNELQLIKGTSPKVLSKQQKVIKKLQQLADWIDVENKAASTQAKRKIVKDNHKIEEERLGHYSSNDVTPDQVYRTGKENADDMIL